MIREHEAQPQAMSERLTRPLGVRRSTSCVDRVGAVESNGMEWGGVEGRGRIKKAGIREDRVEDCSMQTERKRFE